MKKVKDQKPKKSLFVKKLIVGIVSAVTVAILTIGVSAASNPYQIDFGTLITSEMISGLTGTLMSALGALLPIVIVVLGIYLGVGLVRRLIR